MIADHRGHADPDDVRRLIGVEAQEEPQLDHLGGARALGREFGERSVKPDQIVIGEHREGGRSLVGCGRCRDGIQGLHGGTAAAAKSLPVAGAVDKGTTHGQGCRGEEVPAILEVAFAAKAQKSFVGKLGGLDGNGAALGGEKGGREAAELVVERGHGVAREKHRRVVGRAGVACGVVRGVGILRHLGYGSDGAFGLA